ncbi:YitT family protein [Sedimentibacter sp. zth1]|uniref:YitT family protein n=1 Tax=Sedimentibacter sp. zth1 TaxID=2816908 RepID=UPI001A93560A|nr:YitT family protein [Sedimentibacter sp. zth1]QSX05795.1 YitT family protein [Sedimentibacter sp. zth1]
MFNKKTIIEYLLTAVGTSIAASGIFYFLAPESIAIGGVTGFSLVMTSYLPLPLSTVTFISNVILLILGFVFCGREFGGKTIFAVINLSLIMYIMENLFPIYGPITDETLLNLIIGVILFAAGLAIVFNQNASTGGTDILAKIFNKYFNLNFGTALLVADAIVVFMAIFTFGIKEGILGILGWFLKGLLINYFIDGFTIKKEVVIISNKSNEVKDFIFNNINRGVTVYKAEGGYTHESKDIIVTVLSKNQYFKLKKDLKTIDPSVFVLIRNVHEVFGNGFEHF